MAIHRGIQSAIFYYLSCAPCAEARYRKKRKQDAVRSRAERELLEAELPNLYRHPSPSSTNPHWQAEIALGPTLVSRGRKKGNNGNHGRDPRSGGLSSVGSVGHSSVDLPFGAAAVADDRNDSKWNLRLYQREDEELWGSSSHLDGTGSASVESLRRPPQARTTDSASSKYQSFRNPPVNDLHPATFTRVNSREDAAWMLQPPPVAEVMSGKERVSRSRSDSGSSRMSPASLASSRQGSSRLMYNKMRATGDNSLPVSRESASRASNEPTAQRLDRNIATNERDFAFDPVSLDAKEKRKPAQIQIPRGSEESVATTVIRRSSLVPEPGRASQQPMHAASRPQLSTIASDNAISSDFRADSQPPPQASKENDSRSSNSKGANRLSDTTDGQYAAFLVKDNSIRVMRDLSPNKHLSVSTPHGSSGDYEGSPAAAIHPELFDSWYTPEVELPRWVHDVTKREVKQRWSMDL